MDTLLLSEDDILSAGNSGCVAQRASSSMWQWCPQLIAAAATALELIALRGPTYNLDEESLGGPL